MDWTLIQTRKYENKGLYGFLFFQFQTDQRSKNIREIRSSTCNEISGSWLAILKNYIQKNHCFKLNASYYSRCLFKLLKRMLLVKTNHNNRNYVTIIGIVLILLYFFIYFSFFHSSSFCTLWSFQLMEELDEYSEFVLVVTFRLSFDISSFSYFFQFDSTTSSSPSSACHIIWKQSREICRSWVLY